MTEAVQLMLDWSVVTNEQTFGQWIQTHKGDQSCRLLADKHYSRQTIGARMFTRPGKNIVLRTADGKALWVSWKSKYKRKDGYGHAVECTIFRNESEHLSSDLIKMALYATTKIWGELPSDGFITYVDPNSVHSRNAGYCFEKAGFQRLKKRSTRGLIAYRTNQEYLELVLEEMSIVHLLDGLSEQINVALHSGEYMEAYEFQELAELQVKRLTVLKTVMKKLGLKAWSKYQLPLTKRDIGLITSPYDSWMLDTSYLLERGLELDY